MMAAALSVIAVVVVPAVLGFGLLAAIAPRRRGAALETWAIAYPIGLAGVAAILGIWMVSRAPFARWAVVLAPALIGLGLWGWARRRAPQALVAQSAPVKGRRSGRLLYPIVLLVVLAGTVHAMAIFNRHPIVDGDEAWIWTLRGKFLYFDWLTRGAAPAELVAERRVVQAHYPLLNPLVHVWTYVAGGGIGHVLNRVPLQALVLSVVIMTAARLREALRPAAAAMFLLLVVPTAASAPILFSAHADVLVAAGFLLAIEAWRAFSTDRTRASWRLFAVALGVLAWSKQEGLMACACIAAGCLVQLWRDVSLRSEVLKIRSGLLWLGLPVGVFAVTWTINTVCGYENDLTSGGAGRRPLWPAFFAQLGERGLPALGLLLRDVVVSVDVLKLMWLPFLATAVLLPQLAFATQRVQATVALLLAAAGYWFVFVGTHRDLDWQVGCAAERVFFQVWPALLLSVARIAGCLFPRLDAASEHRSL
jgi:hypothetical protein